METYVKTIIVVFALESILKLIFILGGVPVERKPETVAIDLVITVTFIVWGVSVL